MVTTLGRGTSNESRTRLAADRIRSPVRVDRDSGRWDMRPGCKVGAGSWGGSAVGGVLRRVPVRSRPWQSGVLAGGQIAGSHPLPGMRLRPPESRLYATHGGHPLPMYSRGCKVAQKRPRTPSCDPAPAARREPSTPDPAHRRPHRRHPTRSRAVGCDEVWIASGATLLRCMFQPWLTQNDRTFRVVQPGRSVEFRGSEPGKSGEIC